MDLDIRLSVGWTRHHKTQRLKRLLGADACFALLDLWGFARASRPDGHLTGMSEDDIASAAGYWEGRAAPKAFVEILVKCGWLDRDGDHYYLHDWDEHQPWAVGEEARIASARKAGKASARARLERTVNAPSTDRSTDRQPPSLPLPISVVSSSPNGDSLPTSSSGNGARSTGPVPFAKFAHDTWAQRHGAKPPWTDADYALLARAAKRLGEGAEAAWMTYLDDVDDFYAGHGPKKFAGDLGRWAVGGAKAPLSRASRIEAQNRAVAERFANRKSPPLLALPTKEEP